MEVSLMNFRQCVYGLVVVMVILILALPVAAAVQAPAGGAPGQRGGGAPGAGGGGGQRGAANAAPPTNLQVLPKDMTRQQVVAIMQQFNMALGVGCNHCHEEQAGAAPGANGQIPINPPSDAKQEKKTARVMLKLVSDINMKLGTDLGKPAANVVQVTCATCHRGSAIPKTQ
jgi:hypothetical protein